MVSRPQPASTDFGGVHSSGYSILLMSPETGEQRQITTGKIRGDTNPAFSPDGRRIAFGRSVRDETTATFVLDLGEGMAAKGEARRLDDLPSGHSSRMAWTPDGQWIVFGHVLSSTGLWRVPSSGASAPQRLSYATNGTQPALSRRGDMLAFSVNALDSNVWELPLAAPDRAAGPPHKLISSTRMDQNAHFSPDGRRLTFETNRDGKQYLWTANADGSNQQPLISVGPGATGSAAWSPDGTRLVFDGRPANHSSELWMMSPDGGAPQRLTNTNSDNMVPSWSRDGKAVYFVSNRTGRFEVFKMPAGGGEATQITRQGGWFAMESVDGKTLYYQKDRGVIGIWKMPVGGGDEVEVPGTRAFERAWSLTDRGIYSIDVERGASVLKFYDFVTGQIKELAHFDKSVTSGLAVAPDGHSILYSQVDQRGSDIMLVENFR
jgi:Tol biopolymer transport system component